MTARTPVKQPSRLPTTHQRSRSRIRVCPRYCLLAYLLRCLLHSLLYCLLYYVHYILWYTCIVFSDVSPIIVSSSLQPSRGFPPVTHAQPSTPFPIQEGSSSSHKRACPVNRQRSKEEQERTHPPSQPCRSTRPKAAVSPVVVHLTIVTPAVIGPSRAAWQSSCSLQAQKDASESRAPDPVLEHMRCNIQPARRRTRLAHGLGDWILNICFRLGGLRRSARLPAG